MLVLLYKVGMYMPRIVKVQGSIPGVIFCYPNQNLEYSAIYKQKHARNRKHTSNTLLRIKNTWKITWNEQ